VRSTLARKAALAALAMTGFGFGLAGDPRPIAAALTPEPCDGDEGDHERSHARVEKRGRFEALADVSLSSKIEEKLNAIGERFHKRTGKTFVVTSGTRDPDNQAALIYDKLVQGEDLLKLYKDKSAVLELVHAFEEARADKKSKAQTVAAIAATIRAQMKRGIYISAHLKAGAADVRSSTMSPAEKRIFAEAAKDVGLAIMLEATPPHFHLQLE